MFLSIIIPVYNSERYVRRCLDSIWTQNIPEDDFEVICVNDCSVDNSYQILMGISLHHKNLIVLKNETNLRAGGARNNGVKKAHGEYIIFIDSDDYFHNNSLYQVYKYQKEKRLDIFVGDMSRELQDGPISNAPILNYKQMDIMTGREFLLANGFPGGPTKYCFRRSLMVENKVWFEEKVAVEDPDWVWTLPYYAETMQYQPILIHHYVLYPNSSVGAEFRNRNAIYDRLRCANRIRALAQLYETYEERVRINTFANATYKVGLIYLCAIPCRIREKSDIIKTELPKTTSNGLLLFASNQPFLYSVMTSIAYPLFISLLFIKRILFKRK